MNTSILDYRIHTSAVDRGYELYIICWIVALVGTMRRLIVSIFSRIRYKLVYRGEYLTLPEYR
jgi:hypothetical protein